MDVNRLVYVMLKQFLFFNKFCDLVDRRQIMQQDNIRNLNGDFYSVKTSKVPS